MLMTIKTTSSLVKRVLCILIKTKLLEEFGYRGFTDIYRFIELNFASGEYRVNYIMSLLNQLKVLSVDPL